MSSQPANTPAAAGTQVIQPAYESPVAAFIRGNYFYVLSAVAFLAGCYLLINAPFITGAVFVRTLKSFLVLQGYELLLLATAGLITWKIGRGGDVATLFLIALALMLDPTFFGNAFYTMRQGVTPAWPLTVCGLSLVAALVKFEVFRRLLRLVVSWRYIAGFVIAACVVWLAGLVFRRDLAPNTIIWYSYALAWSALIVTIVQGTPYAACHLPGEPATARSNLSLMATVIPPVLCAVHQVELTRVFDLPSALWLYSPYFIALAFAFTRAARPGGDAGVWYMFTYFAVAAAAYLSITGAEFRPVVPGTGVPAALAITGVATGFVFAYGYWKHRSKLALYALVAYCAAIVIGVVVYWFSVYVVPLIRDWRLPDFLMNALSFRSLVLLAAVVFGVLAYRKRNARLWLFSAWSAMVFVTGIIPGGYGSWTMEMIQAMLVALFVYYYAIGSTADNLRKTATLLICVALARNIFAPNTVSLALLVVESVGFLLLSFRFKDFYYSVWGAIGLVVAGGNVAEEVAHQVHPSILAIGVGLLLFGIGLVVTFKKGAVPVAAVAGGSAIEPVVLSPDQEVPAPGAPLQTGESLETPATAEMETAVPDASTPPMQTDADIRDGISLTRDRIGSAIPGDLSQYVTDVFVDDPDLGIKQISRLTPDQLQGLCAMTAIDALQPLVIAYGASGEFHTNLLFLTPIQIAITSGIKGYTTRFIPYNSIALISRNYSTIAIRTHAGNGFTFTCASPLQAELLSYGIEQVLVEAIIRLDEENQIT